LAEIRYALTLRTRAIAIITRVFTGQTLDVALDADRETHGRHGLVEELAIGTIRQGFGLASLVTPLLKRPFKAADQDIYALILMGFYQARFMDTPVPVAVSEAVATAAALGKPWARGVVNAVLRKALALALPESFSLQNHPAWLVARLKAAWPEAWPAILAANDRRAPLVLRVDTRRITRENYLETLAQAGYKATAHDLVPSAIVLALASLVQDLPGFREGQVSVQDAAAQCAAGLLAPEPGDTILDACAAPGGKTGHLFQMMPEAAITAVDRDPARVLRLRDTLARLGAAGRVEVLTLDLAQTALTGHFTRILLDAPCSATGVIRRHPDIKLRRREEDMAILCRLQSQLLDRLWQNLAPGGTMLYATCSILPEENDWQIEAFLSRTPDARSIALHFPVGRACRHGFQFLPGESDMDGFYYARLHKAP